VSERGVPSGPEQAGGVSRRALLRVGLAGAAGLTAAACGGPDQPGRLALGDRSLIPRPTPTPSAVITPKPALRRSKPVFTLSDFAVKPPARAIALTIDDGPSPRWTPMVLDLLGQHQVHATFCLVGQEVRRHPELVQRIVAAGHAVCNHTLSHPLHFGKMPTSRVEREITQTTQAIMDAAGVTPRVFRSPGGDWSPTVLSAVAQHGMVPIDWSVDPRDWSRPGVAAITQRMLAARAGEIVLCHDGGGNRAETVAALRTVIPALRSRGLQFVTL
jgi:peptidoglycan/xylan/chitin deacetylase (PgdA/CDA1 family)